MNLENDIKKSIAALQNGGIILYPTDTIWGIGCDATNEQAVLKIFTLKQRKDSKTMIMLISNGMNIEEFVTSPDPEISKYLSTTFRPTTAIYKNGKNVAGNLLNDDGTIAIRITRDEFCSSIIKKLNRPIVSTSANISGKPAPKSFQDIDPEIKKGVDYVVQHRRSDSKVAVASAIIKMNEEREIVVIRS